MKKSRIKLLAGFTVLAIALTFMVFPVSQTSAANGAIPKVQNPTVQRILNKNVVKTMDAKGEPQLSIDLKNLTGDEIQSISAVAIAVFVLSILTAYIIGGIIIYISGKSADQWVAEALKWAHTKIKDLICTKTKVLYGVDNYGCRKFHPDAPVECLQ